MRALLAAKAVLVSLTLSGAAFAAPGDSAIHSRIDAKIDETRADHASRIRVNVDDGVATLRGQVGGGVVRANVVEAARSVEGVERVRDRLRYE